MYDRCIIRPTTLSSASATAEWTSSVSPKRGMTPTARVSGVYVPAIVDRPRPRVHDDLSTNHGGVAVVTSDCVSMSPVAVTSTSTFEHVAAHVVCGQFNCIVVALYRPGSATVQQRFFDELADDDSYAAVVRRQVVTDTRAWSVDDVETAGT